MSWRVLAWAVAIAFTAWVMYGCVQDERNATYESCWQTQQKRDRGTGDTYHSFDHPKVENGFATVLTTDGDTVSVGGDVTITRDKCRTN